MPPKQQTLNLPKTRRSTKQQSTAVAKNKSLFDDSTIQIGGANSPSQPPDTITTKKKLEIHQEHLNETDKMLRAFDLNYAYGPCVGINRIDRWERAKELGLNPPQMIKDILMNDKSSQYQKSVFSQFPMI